MRHFPWSVGNTAHGSQGTEREQTRAETHRKGKRSHFSALIPTKEGKGSVTDTLGQLPGASSRPRLRASSAPAGSARLRLGRQGRVAHSEGPELKMQGKALPSVLATEKVSTG